MSLSRNCCWRRHICILFLSKTDCPLRARNLYLIDIGLINFWLYSKRIRPKCNFFLIFRCFNLFFLRLHYLPTGGLTGHHEIASSELKNTNNYKNIISIEFYRCMSDILHGLNMSDRSRFIFCGEFEIGKYPIDNFNWYFYICIMACNFFIQLLRSSIDLYLAQYDQYD